MKIKWHSGQTDTYNARSAFSAGGTRKGRQGCRGSATAAGPAGGDYTPCCLHDCLPACLPLLLGRTNQPCPRPAPHLVTAGGVVELGVELIANRALLSLHSQHINSKACRTIQKRHG